MVNIFGRCKLHPFFILIYIAKKCIITSILLKSNLLKYMINKVKLSLLSITIILLGFQALPVYASQHSLGSNIITPAGTVYTVTTENEQIVRRPYTSAGAFLSYSFNSWSTI